MPTTLINVSNRLPVTLDDDKITKSSGGLVAALEGLSADVYKIEWIGWPGGVTDPARQEAVERELIEKYGCIPVFLSEEEAEAHYEGFSNSSVWPLLHYMPDYLHYEPGWWEKYREVNQRFADKVLSIAREGDIVWVHDYQLLLLPGMLRAASPTLKVGFFLHTPFPAYEVFRCHPRRAELIEGMLGADLLGFHTFGYLRHFRSTAARLSGLETQTTRVLCADGRRASLGVFPIGINARKFEEALDQPEHKERQDKFRQTFQGKQIVLSVERMDYTKGILQRLEAVDCYLAEHENRDDIKFIFVSVPSREGVEDYQELRADVESRIGRLNGKYATLHNSPIHFIHGSVEFPDLCALYSIADAGLVTPLIDGMNLVAKEYLACQRDHSGPLILSEFAGAAEELFNAVIVNPYDAQAVADSVARALAMSPEEKRARNEPMRARIKDHDAQHWAASFIGELARIRPPTPVPDTSDLSAESAHLTRILADGGRVGIFLDYDGTLREIVRDPAAATPGDELLALLQSLAAHPGVDVTIISGRSADDLQKMFGDLPIGLVAEHGASERTPGSREWQALDSQVNSDWREQVRPILQLAATATPGSFVEEKRTSLVWHYRASDPEFGTWKANQMVEELGAVTSNDPVQVRHGKKIVEVVSTQVSKGIAVANLVATKNYGGVVCAGDDQTDESMFALDVPGLVTIKIGGGMTQARTRLPDPLALRQFLARLAH